MTPYSSIDPHELLKKLIREVPDFPKPGILFYDITTLLKDPDGFRLAVDALVDYFADKKIDLVIGIEARGFIFASMVAYRLKAGFIPVRKPKKLPAAVKSVAYDFEYDEGVLEIHNDAITKGARVLIIDDLLATGGTAQAVIQMVEHFMGTLVGLGFLIELEFLAGRKKLGNYDIYSVIKYGK